VNTMTDMRGTTVTAASGTPLAASRYRIGSTLLAHTATVFTGAVCLQETPNLRFERGIWGGATGGFGSVEASRPAAVRQNPDSSKPRHGSQASDGSG
jgi:hypothetical protein